MFLFLICHLCLSNSQNQHGDGLDTKIKTLLADDEPLAIERLDSLLAGHQDILVVGRTMNGIDTIDAIRRLKPDLCFLDVQMPDGDGFDVLESLEPEEWPVIIFETAYDNYAVKAFDCKAIDYLLKPFSAERLADALARAKIRLMGEAALSRQRVIQNFLEDVSPRSRNRMILRIDGRTVVVPVEEIDAIEAEANTMWVHRSGKDVYPFRSTMAALEAGLDKNRFFRAHRSWLLNIERIAEIKVQKDGNVTAITTGGIHVPVSEPKRRELNSRLNLKSIIIQNP